MWREGSASWKTRLLCDLSLGLFLYFFFFFVHMLFKDHFTPFLFLICSPCNLTKVLGKLDSKSFFYFQLDSHLTLHHVLKQTDYEMPVSHLNKILFSFFSHLNTSGVDAKHDFHFNFFWTLHVYIFNIPVTLALCSIHRFICFYLLSPSCFWFLCVALKQK